MHTFIHTHIPYLSASPYPSVSLALALSHSLALSPSLSLCSSLPLSLCLSVSLCLSLCLFSSIGQFISLSLSLSLPLSLSLSLPLSLILPSPYLPFALFEKLKRRCVLLLQHCTHPRTLACVGMNSHNYLLCYTTHSLWTSTESAHTYKNTMSNTCLQKEFRCLLPHTDRMFLPVRFVSSPFIPLCLPVCVCV